MAVHVWTEAGVGDGVHFSVASPFQVETDASIAGRSHPTVHSLLWLPESSRLCRTGFVFSHHIQTSEKCGGTNAALRSEPAGHK